MSKLSVDVVRERTLWEAVLREFPDHDFGHTYDFHAISSANGEGIPVLFVVRNGAGACILCWPALKRPIAGSTYCDLTGVYGYSGPLLAEGERSWDALELVYDEMKNEGIVTLFARMHPLLDDVNRLTDCPVEHVGNVVVMDTIDKPDRKKYRSNHRRDIRKAERMGMSTFIDENCVYIESFQKLYTHTMTQLGARDYYFFDDKYFQGLMDAGDFVSTLLMAKWESHIIGGLLLIRTNKIMHYYLGGIHRDYLNLSPLKLLLADAHEYAHGIGVRTLVLGGGPGGLDDALLHFKRGFSDIVLPFYVCKKIINLAKFKDICNERGVSSDIHDYFPPYRANSTSASVV